MFNGTQISHSTRKDFTRQKYIMKVSAKYLELTLVTLLSRGVRLWVPPIGR